MNFLLLLTIFVMIVNGQQQQSCPTNWHHFEGSCYMALHTNVPALEARNHCLKMKSDLVSIISESEDFFVRGLIARLDPKPDLIHNRYYTIGLQLKRNAIGEVEKGEWFDHMPVTYGNPSISTIGKHPWSIIASSGTLAKPEHNCVAMIRSRTSVGDWYAVPCLGTSVVGGYVCKFALEQGNNDRRAEHDAQPQALCSNGYVALGQDCFKAFESTIATAATAELACRADGGHLATIGSQQEDIFIKGLINHVHPDNLGKQTLYRYFIGMQLQRDAAGNIVSARWQNGDSSMQYGDPTAQGFGHGTGPWATGTEWAGEPEPKASRDATVVFVAKNSATGGHWAAGMPTLTGGYVCQISNDAGKTDQKKRVRVRVV